MAKILFVDDRVNEIVQLWTLSGCDENHELLPLRKFESIEQTIEDTQTYQPDVVIVGYGLGKNNLTGVDVIIALQNQNFKGDIITNSGGGVEQFSRSGIKLRRNANRNPIELNNILNNL